MDQPCDYLAHSANGVGLLAHSSRGTGAGPSAEPVMQIASQSRFWNPSAFLPQEPDPSCSVPEFGMTLSRAVLVGTRSQYQAVWLSVAPELPRPGMILYRCFWAFTPPKHPCCLWSYCPWPQASTDDSLQQNFVCSMTMLKLSLGIFRVLRSWAWRK